MLRYILIRENIQVVHGHGVSMMGEVLKSSSRQHRPAFARAHRAGRPSRVEQLTYILIMCTRHSRACRMKAFFMQAQWDFEHALQTIPFSASKIHRLF